MLDLLGYRLPALMGFFRLRLTWKRDFDASHFVGKLNQLGMRSRAIEDLDGFFKLIFFLVNFRCQSESG